MLSLNRYVNTVVKPTLHELAEYEARSAAVQAMNRAVAAELTRSPALCDALLRRAPGLSAWTPQPPGRADPICQRRADRDGRSAGDLLCRPVRQSDEQFPAERPWPRLAAVDPAQGVCAGEIRETTQSLSINTTRYSAVLQLSVTVNMILDGKHGHADCCGGLSAGKACSSAAIFRTPMPPIWIEFAPQMWYTKLIPTNGV